jgi:hypothetical protein
MGVSEKRVVKTKLNNLLNFIKAEEQILKSVQKGNKDSRSYREYEHEKRLADFHLNYESVIFKESEYLEEIKIAIARCIISIELIDEMSRSPKEFNKAVKKLSKEERDNIQSLKFSSLTRDVSNDKSLKNFIKRILEVQAERCTDLKETRKMCETWHSK